MKRDFEVIRSLLLQVEGAARKSIENNPWTEFFAENISRAEIIYHVRLLVDLGLFYPTSVNLQADSSEGILTAKFLPDALTNEGHEFLESIRDPDIWRKTKAGVRSVGSSGFSLIKALAKGFIRTEIKKRTGLDIDP